MPVLTRRSNGNALWVAVRAKRIDIVRLLLDRGVPVNAVDFESVCYSCDPELIQLFLDRGADPITGNPIYRGFQNCLKPIIAVYKANIEAVPALQLQADMALCYFAKKGNLRCVSLLLWAGARPDVKIPEDDSKPTSAIAARSKRRFRAETVWRPEENAAREISGAIAGTTRMVLFRFSSQNSRISPDPFA